MTSIQHHFNSADVSESVKKTKEILENNRGNLLSNEQLSELNQTVQNSGGLVSDKERKFLQIIQDQNNLKILQKGAFKADEFTLSISQKKYKSNAENLPEPINNSIDPKFKSIDKGKDFDEQMADSRSVADVKKDINQDLSAKKEYQELQPKVNNFLNKFSDEDSDNKEAMIYFQALLNRNPPLSADNLEKVINRLTKMVDTKYDKRAGDAKDLVTSALHDISCPSDISQRTIGTCSGTSIQTQLAIKDPLKYLEIIDNLAQNKSFATGTNDYNGKPIILKPNWTFVDDGKGRTVSCSIIQNSLMNFSTGNGSEYDSKLSEEKLKGITNYDSEQLHLALFGKKVTDYSADRFNSDQLLKILEKSQPRRENPIQISLYYDEKGKRDSLHAVNVVGFEKVDNTVTIINPWGREETMSVDTLKNRITGVITDNKYWDTDFLSEENFGKYSGSEKNNAKAITLINDPQKKDAFLGSLDSYQKGKLLKEIIESKNISPEAKKATIFIIEDLLNGSEEQNKSAISSALVSIYGISNDDAIHLEILRKKLGEVSLNLNKKLDEIKDLKKD